MNLFDISVFLFLSCGFLVVCHQLKVVEGNLSHYRFDCFCYQNLIMKIYFYFFKKFYHFVFYFTFAVMNWLLLVLKLVFSLENIRWFHLNYHQNLNIFNWLTFHLFSFYFYLKYYMQMFQEQFLISAL